MHIRSILAIARKDALDILLNKSTLFVLIMPIALSVFFALIGSLLSTHTYDILVYDPDHSQVVQAVKSAFTSAIITQANAPEDVTAAFGPNGSHKSSSYSVGLIVPPNFDASLRQGSHPQLTIYLNGDDLNNLDGQAILNAVSTYTRAVANPTPPATITTALINPPSTFNTATIVSQSYVMTALLVSFVVGTSLMPGLLIEEKEKKTLRMLMVSPASFGDVVLGKLLVVIGYQLMLSLIILLIQGGFIGQVGMTLLYVLLGAGFCLALGLVVGSIFNSSSAAGGVSGLTSFIYIVPAIFVGVLSTFLQNNPIEQIIKVLPTYYLADGIFNSVQNTGTWSGHLLDIGVLLACTVILLLIAVATLRRQAAVVATI